MAGEGLGKDLHETDETPVSLRGGADTRYDVVAVGDLIVDHVVDYAAAPDWDQEDWMPGPGESMVVDDVPDAVHDYIEEALPGGRGPNQAVAAASAGATTAALGTGGDEDVQALLEDAGVDTTHMRDGYETGDAYVMVEEDGDNRIPCVLGDSMDTAYVDDVRETVQDADYVLVSNGEPDAVLSHLLDALNGMAGPDVIYDPAPLDGAGELLQHDAIDYVTPNEEEYDALRGKLERFDGTVIRTRSDGAIVDGQLHVYAPDVEPVDTTGAGDTFNGYLAAGLADGKQLVDAVEDAVYAASLSVTRDGAQPAIPDRNEVDAFHN